MEKEKIIKIISELLDKTPIDYEGIDIKEDFGRVIFVIKTNDSKILIGKGGANILSLKYLVFKIADKKIGREREQFSIDVNDYYQKQTDGVKKEALKQGERVRFFKHDVELEPMSSYKRMLVHSTFSESDDIETYSSGEGENRHIVIHYKGKSNSDI